MVNKVKYTFSEKKFIKGKIEKKGTVSSAGSGANVWVLEVW